MAPAAILELAELRAWLRLSDDAEDAVLALCEAAALTQAEAFLRRPLVSAPMPDGTMRPGLFVSKQAVPAAVRQALLLLAGGQFSARGGFDPAPAFALLRPWRRLRIGGEA